MYRIAVIQNEVEMQHSGYVDSVPKYMRQDFDLREHVFNRFSSVNIGDLFIEGENYILDYDCLIIGTNATSDGDIYNILCDSKNKEIMSQYIELGKGLLICSQKKLKDDSDAEEKEYKARRTYFLPDPYEYKVVSRPSNENSDDGNVIIFDNALNNIQEFILNYPQKIDNNIISDHCKKNDFQPHFYRDYIKPLNDSSYFTILYDDRELPRNTLMVACPRKNEKIVISTMALDWAGHYELIENILYYLMVGIPSVAFIKKKDEFISDFDFLTQEADLSKISYYLYDSFESAIKSDLKKYHTLYVCSPTHTEDEVYSFWESNIKEKDNYIKLFYYKYIKNELVLVNFSYYSFIDAQKREVETWIKSEYSDGFWGNSFWKTYDVLFAFYNIGNHIQPYIKNTFIKISQHYRKGSYDGVLAPTCGLLELECLMGSSLTLKEEVPFIDDYLKETKQWLIEKFKKTSSYNKKFIIRSFYCTGNLKELADEMDNFKDDLLNVAMDGNVDDKLEIDLCLDIEVCFIYLKLFGERKEINVRIKDGINNILETQLQNGRWDNNLGKTARILTFLIGHFEKDDFRNNKEKVKISIERGINALRNAYNGHNWEENIMTTANSISAIVMYDRIAPYKSKDFLNQVNKESKLTESYNSLILALDTVDNLIKQNGIDHVKLIEMEHTQIKLKKCSNRLYTMTSIACISMLLVLSYYLFLFLEDINLFKKMIFESFMWIPIATGVAITGLIEIIPKIINKRINADIYNKK